MIPVNYSEVLEEDLTTKKGELDALYVNLDLVLSPERSFKAQCYDECHDSVKVEQQKER